MSFGQALTTFIVEQGTVIESGNRKSQRAIKKNLSRRRNQQIRSTHDFRNLHRVIVGDDSQLIGRNAVVSPDEEIAKIFSRDKGMRSTTAVGERNCLAVWNAE